MQSTLSLTLDLTTKKGFFTDITDYAAINVNVANLGAMGSVQVYFQGTLVDTLPINLGGVPSTWVSTQFDLELDVNGEVANGSYSAVYYVGYNFTTSCQISAANTIKVLNYGDNVLGFPAGVGITISGAPSVTSTIVSATDSVTNSLDIVIASSSLAPGLPVNKTITVAGFETGNFSWVYAGCSMVESKASLVADCDYGDFGTFTVSNETNLEGVTLQSLTVDINYPSWTNQATITQTALPFTQNNLATGTYSVELTQQIEKVQNDGLIINYEATCIQEFKVTCSGSLCGLNECIENLRKAHEAELLKNKVSKYQVYVDNILVYYMEAENYKACGEMDKYRAEVAKIEAQLDASGCDCGCCDENVYKWVQNTSANAINIIASITQLQNDVDVIENDIIVIQGDVSALQANAVLTADNGLTKTANNVALGGALIGDTSVDLLSYQLKFEASTGSSTFIRDYAPNNLNLTTPLNVRGENNGVYPIGNGPAISFQTSNAGTATNMGFLGFVWEDPNNGDSQFRVFTKQGNSFAWKFLVQSDGQIKGSEYGQGNFQNNNPDYFLGVDGNGAFIEIDPANVGSNTTAINGLNKVGNDIKLGGNLTSPTTITTSNVNTLALAGLQSGSASSILALNNANKIITVYNTIPYRVYCACVSQTGANVPTVEYTVINTLGVNPTYGNGGTGEYTFQIPGTDLTKAFISLTTGDVPQKPNGVLITFVISTQNPETMRIYTYSAGVGKEAELLKKTLIKIEFYA